MPRGLCEVLRREREEQHRGGRSTIRPLLAGKALLDPDFSVAAQHARAVAGNRAKRDIEPVFIRRCDYEARVPGAERFGVGVDNLGGANPHGRIVAGKLA